MKTKPAKVKIIDTTAKTRNSNIGTAKLETIPKNANFIIG